MTMPTENVVGARGLLAITRAGAVVSQLAATTGRSLPYAFTAPLLWLAGRLGTRGSARVQLPGLSAEAVTPTQTAAAAATLAAHITGRQPLPDNQHAQFRSTR